MLAADVGQPEAVLAEQAPAARPSSSPPPARPLAEEIRPFGPSPHDMAETSAQGARQAVQPGLFMSKSVWCTFLCLLSSPGSFVFVLYQVLMLRTYCFVGDVMAGLLTMEERAAAAGVRFGLGQPGLMAPGPSEYRAFLSYSSFGLLLLPISDRPSDLSCCCFFLLRRLLRHLYLRLGRVLSWGSWKRRRWSPAFGVFIVRFAFLTLLFCVYLFFFEQIASNSV